MYVWICWWWVPQGAFQACAEGRTGCTTPQELSWHIVWRESLSYGEVNFFALMDTLGLISCLGHRPLISLWRRKHGSCHSLVNCDVLLWWLSQSAIHSCSEICHHFCCRRDLQLVTTYRKGVMIEEPTWIQVYIHNWSLFLLILQLPEVGLVPGIGIHSFTSFPLTYEVGHSDSLYLCLLLVTGSASTSDTSPDPPPLPAPGNPINELHGVSKQAWLWPKQLAQKGGKTPFLCSLCGWCTECEGGKCPAVPIAASACSWACPVLLSRISQKWHRAV